jgi:hypothetical protein
MVSADLRLRFLVSGNWHDRWCQIIKATEGHLQHFNIRYMYIYDIERGKPNLAHF